MRKLLLLVLILTASARPPVHDEKLPFRDQPFDHVVKADVLTVVKKEPIVQHTEAEQDPLMQDEPVADVVENDLVLLEPERREEHRITEETSAIVEEPVLEADYLTEDMPEAELEPEPEIAAIQINRNNIPVEEPAVELESVAEMEYEKEENFREEPTLEGDFIVEEDPEELLEPVRERRMALQTAGQDPLMQDEPVADVVENDSVLLEPERREEHRITEETSAIVEEPVLEADYLTEDMPEAELEPEPEIAAIQINRNNIPVEEPAVELESVAEMEYEKEEHFREEPTLEGDFIVVEDPEEVLEPVRERRMALQTAEQDLLMQDEPVADVVEPDSVLLEPERREEHRITEEEPVPEAGYLTEDMPEAELEPEPEIVAIQMKRNNISVEEPVAEMKMEVESDKKKLQQPTLEGDNIVSEDPEEVMEPVRGPRKTLQTGRWSCRGVVRQGKCYQFFRRNLDANTAEVM